MRTIVQMAEAQAVHELLKEKPGLRLGEFSSLDVVKDVAVLIEFRYNIYYLFARSFRLNIVTGAVFDQLEDVWMLQGHQSLNLFF